MIFANLDNTTVNLRFEPYNGAVTEECSYALGEGLFDYLSFDIDDVYSLYMEMSEV
jgi:hypothetical protein